MVENTLQTGLRLGEYASSWSPTCAIAEDSQCCRKCPGRLAKELASQPVQGVGEHDTFV